MKIIRFILMAFLICWAVVPAWAVSVPEELTDGLPGEAEQILDGINGGLYDHGSLLLGVEKMWHTARDGFLSLFRDNINGLVLLLGVVLLCGVLEDLRRSSDSPGPNVVSIAGALVITMFSVGSLRNLIGMGMETMEELDVFAKTLLPTLSAAVAAGGGMVSAGVNQVATVYFTSIMISLIRSVLLPLVYCYIAVSVADAILPEHDLKQIQKGIDKVTTRGLTGLLLAFTCFLTLTKAAGAAADSTTVRLTRSAISTAIPVVGGIVSDATESVLASAGILKSSIGIFGMLGVLAICLTPFLHLAVQFMLYKLTGFLTATVGAKPLVELIDALGTAFGLVLGMVGSCAILLLISVAMSVSVVVT